MLFFDRVSVNQVKGDDLFEKKTIRSSLRSLESQMVGRGGCLMPHRGDS